MEERQSYFERVTILATTSTSAVLGPLQQGPQYPCIDESVFLHELHPLCEKNNFTTYYFSTYTRHEFQRFMYLLWALKVT